MKFFKNTLLPALLIAGLFTSSLSLLLPTNVSAISGSDFDAGNIISDAVFFHKNSMTASEIQAFLNSKVPDCDTNGTEIYSGSTTRAERGTSQGFPPPYTCLKSFKQNTPEKAGESGLCGHLTAKTNRTAAQIIYDVAQACGISPKVLLVTLQKEQGLITDEWPWSSQYRIAMGYGCPDTAPCDSEYYGFFNQVYSAARQFKRYAADADLFTYRAKRNNKIYFNPGPCKTFADNGSCAVYYGRFGDEPDIEYCGFTNVYIENQASANLYNYTPYQPNAATLAVGLGVSAPPCGAYGNKNFWWYFTLWFGSTQTTIPYAVSIDSSELFSNSARTGKYNRGVAIAPLGKTYARIKARNIGYKTWSQTNVRVGTTTPRDRSSVFADGSWINNGRPAALLESSVDPGEVGTFEFVLDAPATTGSYSESFALVAEGETWMVGPTIKYSVDVVQPATASSSANELSSGSELLAGESITSPDKHSVLALKQDGNLVLYSDNQTVWSTRTGGNSGSKLVMQGDGNLVLYNKKGQPLWHSKTYGNSNARLSLQTDGNLVIYSQANAPLWYTSTTTNPRHLAHVNKSLQAGYVLFPGQSLRTANRKYRLSLQTDGNLVLYSPTRPLWHTKTFNKSAAYLVMQGDGNLVLYDDNGRPLWHTRTYNNSGSHLILQADGNLVLYKSNGQPLWHTRTYNQE